MIDLGRLARELLNRLRFESGKAVLRKESHGTPFADVQRRINMYLRALWAREFNMKQTGRHFEKNPGYLPYIENHYIHLPDAYEDFEEIPGGEVYRAASAHAAAHLVYTNAPISAESLDNWQIAVISVVEDARVEALAMREFPGLKQIWSRLHKATPAEAETAGDYLDRLARALLDETYRDDDPWIVLGRRLFKEASLDTNRVSRDIGVKLAQAFGEKNMAFNPRTDLLSPPYRDDNRYVWESARAGSEMLARIKTGKRLLRFASRFGMTNEVAAESDEEDAKQASILSVIFNFKREFADTREKRALLPGVAPFHYPEWDYRIQSEQEFWVLLLEMQAKSGELKIIEDIIARNKHLISRMKILLDAIQPEGVQRIRKLEEGDEIDVNAAVRAQIDIRMGMQPDSRIMMRAVRKTRDISVLVLLDISKSTNDKIKGQKHTVLELTREACVLLADAIFKVGDPFAIHGFCSDSRHHVEYFRFKDFDQPYDDAAKSRLAGMTGQLSTRMGAAIRHATHYLNKQKSEKKLLMVITDGEPADVDVRDHKYLQYDAKKAVEEARRSGILTYCMNLDPKADHYVSRIFGQRNYMVVDHVKRLPEKLPILYAGLTR